MVFGYCPKCEGKGFVSADYYDEINEVLTDFLQIDSIKFCDRKHCDASKDLNERVYSPLKHFIKNTIIYKKLMLLGNKFFWSKLEYTARKILRFPIRVIEFAKVIYNDDEFSEYSILDLIEFKLNRMAKAHLEQGKDYKKHGYNYLHDERRYKEILVCLRCLDKYKNTEKYIKTSDYNIWPEETKEGYFELKSDITEHQLEERTKLYAYQNKNIGKFWSILSRKFDLWVL